ncbi:hypothetical protein HK104_007541, partial [Borealophlyctis nickersoniae]
MVGIKSVTGMIVVAYNIPRLTTPLTLTRQTIADIFSGRITTWTDATLLARNPSLRDALATTLPPPQIQLVVRRPGSGTTFNFVTALKAFDPTFPAPINTTVDWSGVTNRTVYVASTNGAIGDVVSSVPYTVTYMDGQEAATAMNVSGSTVGVASIVNRNGDVVVPNAQSMKAAYQTNISTTAQPIDSPNPGAYPITVHTHFMIHNNSISDDIETARWTLRFLWWSLNRGE